MNTEIIGVIFMYLATIALAIPLGRYIAKVFKGEKTWLNFMAPLEKFIFKIQRHRHSPRDELETAFKGFINH